MAMGKGFFWSGLGDSVANLYNQNVNERMAGKAQAAREAEGAKQRAHEEKLLSGKENKFDIDAFNALEGSVSDAEKALQKQHSDIDNNAMLSSGQKAIRHKIVDNSPTARQIRAQRQALHDAYGQIGKSRLGVSTPEPAPYKEAPVTGLRAEMKAFAESFKNKGGK